MAKESDLENIELKVSVNCCDGCKKKVKKALQSIEGVLKIEVDSQQPKVTVLGNVDPQKLIKRLSKVGKQAEVRKYGNQNAEKKGEMIMSVPNSVAKDTEHKSKTKINDWNEQAKSKPSSGSGGNNHTRKDEGTKTKEEVMGDSNYPIPIHSDLEEKVKVGYKVTETTDSDMMGMGSNERTYSGCGTQTQYAVTVPLPLPCYAIAVPSYAYTTATPLSLPLPQTQTCCSQEYHCQQPPLFQSPTTRVGDYFSDDNTIGCTVM